MKFTGLKNGTTYTIYLAATDGYSNYPMRMLDDYIIELRVTTKTDSIHLSISFNLFRSCCHFELKSWNIIIAIVYLRNYC